MRKLMLMLGLICFALVTKAQDFILTNPIVSIQTTIVNRVSADRVILDFKATQSGTFMVAMYSYHDTKGNVTQSGAIPMTLAEVAALGASAGVDVSVMLQQMMGIANAMLQLALNPPPPPPPPPPIQPAISINIGGGLAQQREPNYSHTDGPVPFKNWNFVDAGVEKHEPSKKLDFPQLRNSAGDIIATSGYIVNSTPSASISLLAPSNSILGSGAAGYDPENWNRAYQMFVQDIPYAKYDVYAITGYSGTTSNRTVSLVGSTTQAIEFVVSDVECDAGTFDDASVDGEGNYVVFRDLTNSAVALEFYSPNAGRCGIVSGIQIVEIK